MKKIVITIKPDGTIEGNTENIKGKACMKYISEIEKITEAKTIDSAFTDEYYEVENVETENLVLENKV